MRTLTCPNSEMFDKPNDYYIDLSFHNFGIKNSKKKAYILCFFFHFLNIYIYIYPDSRHNIRHLLIYLITDINNRHVLMELYMNQNNFIIY